MIERLIEQYKETMRGFALPYVRHIYQNLESSHRIVGIVGGRGVGKTTYMLHYLSTQTDISKTLYVSADSIYFGSNTILGLAEQFVRLYDGRLLCIDEIHRYPNWSQELKNIYDTYPDLKIIFSGSSSINLSREKFDLSRRAVLKHLPGFSFREYLEFVLDLKIDVMSLDDVVRSGRDMTTLAQTPRLLYYFKQYLKTGYYPIFRELKHDKDIYDALVGVIDTVIQSDIASYYNIKSSTLAVFKKILYFVQTSTPSSISTNKLANSLGKDNDDVASYLDMLKESGLLRYLLIDKYGHALIRNTEKVFLNNTNMYFAIGDVVGIGADIGTIREVFVLSHLQNAGHSPFWSKRGDMACDGYTFEIGGKGKDRGQIGDLEKGFLIKDDVLFGDDRSIPLYWFGMLY